MAAYVMKNDEWSLQVNLKKTDSETGSQIAADAQYEIYQWDVVTGKYQPTGGYNTYIVQRQGDGTYEVINSAAYATTDAMRHTLYYTQRNQGKFILVETKAPAGYFGDWTDIDHPGTAGTPLGKRAYYIEITEANDNAVLWLDNADYNADILTADKGGTKLVTSGGVETTVSIYSTAKDSTRTYSTDNSGKAANEDSYTTTATDGVMKNDRTLGEISISKVDLDAVKYTNHGNALTEVTAPDGYAIAERVEFEVLPTGEVQTFEMFDDTIKVKISKVDITTNKELPGAELIITNKDGKKIDHWVSTDKPHYIEKLPAGEYTLTEITAPDGYDIAESIRFTVLPTGEVQTVVMKDARTPERTPQPEETPHPTETPQPTPSTTPAPTPAPQPIIPQTGDTFPLGLLLTVAGISLAGLAALLYKSVHCKAVAQKDDDETE